MSWFDSSFGFAKTALSQAQKSIDRALDIEESEKLKRSQEKDEKQVQTSSSFNTEKESDTADTVQASKSLTDSFVSTWGNMDSYWGSKPDTVVKETNEPTPIRKSKPKATTNKKPANTSSKTPVTEQSTPSNETTPTATPPPPSNTDDKTSPVPFNPVTTDTTNLTSTPMQHEHEETVDGEGSGTNTASDNSFSGKPTNDKVTEPVICKEEVEGDDVMVGEVIEEGVQLHVPDEEIKPDKMVEENQEKLKKTEEEIDVERVENERRQKEEEKLRQEENERRKQMEEEETKKREEKERADKQELSNKLEKHVQEAETVVVSGKHIQEENQTIVSISNTVPLEQLQQSSIDNSSLTGDKNTGRELEGTNQSSDTTQTETNPLRPAEDVVALETELTQVKELLHVRESKILEQSEELIKIQQTNQEMQKCLDDFKRQIERMDDSKDSLTRRINAAEEKIQTVTRERNSLKKQLQTLNNEQKGMAEKRLTEMLKEKDEMVAGLMEEGEKLSKQELQSNNVIKKLRSKEKASEAAINTQKQQIEEFENEIKSLKDIIKKKEENELKYQESLTQMNLMIEQQAKELNQIKPEKNELTEKARSLQTNLDNAYKELTELRKSNALSQSAMEEATVSAQQVAKDELKKELEEQRIRGMKEKDALLFQISELRMGVSRTEQQATWREDQLRQEISDLHQRIQESEGRNQDLSDTISDATRPLLRQIEHLRSAQAAQSSNWERLESSLTQRLVEAQTQLNAASEKERNAVEKLLTLQSRVSTLEEQLTSVRQERSQLMASLETERTKLRTLEETHSRELSRHESYRLNVQQNVEELKKEKDTLERQLEYERVRLEAESRKADLELQEKEKLRNQLAMSLTSMPPPALSSLSRQSSTSTPNESLPNMDTLSSGSTSDINSLLLRGGGFPGGGSLGSASVLEHLQSLLKQKEGELNNSQEMVSSLERSRAAITEELTKMSASNEALKREVETIPDIKQQLLEITQKYEALLQMFGEKVEEAEELRLDIQDLKSLYRQQIEELLVK